MTFSTITIILGVVYLLPQVYALVNPDGFKTAARAFPRNTKVGYVLTLAATAWFLYYVQLEEIADFEGYKKFMLAGFAALGVGTCIYLKDLLAIRGLAVFLLLLAKLVCDTGRWVDTPLRLLVITWAYVWILAGMWWTISPWRGRDWLEWNVSDATRLRILSGLRAAFSIAVIAMGATIFRV
jgi:hypothetical protein